MPQAAACDLELQMPWAGSGMRSLTVAGHDCTMRHAHDWKDIVSPPPDLFYQHLCARLHSVPDRSRASGFRAHPKQLQRASRTKPLRTGFMACSGAKAPPVSHHSSAIAANLSSSAARTDPPVPLPPRARGAPAAPAMRCHQGSPVWSPALKRPSGQRFTQFLPISSTGHDLWLVRQTQMSVSKKANGVQSKCRQY